MTAEGITDGTLIDPVATGSLAISKKVTVGDGLTPSPDTNFTFSVQFGSELSGTYETKTTSEKGAQEEETGKLTVTNGQATVTLQADQTITIQGLPAGTTYTVTETERGDGFTQTAPEGAAMGTISANRTETAAFTNTYEVAPVSLAGSTALQVKRRFRGKRLKPVTNGKRTIRLRLQSLLPPEYTNAGGKRDCNRQGYNGSYHFLRRYYLHKARHV